MTEELPLKPVVGGVEPQGFARISRSCPGSHGLCHLRCPARWQAPRRQGAKWFWRGRGLGSGQRFSRRHIPRRLYLAIRRDRLCAARVSEEIEDGARDTSARCRANRKACARGRENSRRGKRMSKKRYEVGSGNVFKDLGIPNAEEHLVKAQLVFKIESIMKSRRLKQAEAAELLGIKQPDVSNMLRGEFRQFSVERLLRFLVALDHDGEIIGKPHRGRIAASALHVSWSSVGALSFATGHSQAMFFLPRGGLSMNE